MSSDVRRASRRMVPALLLLLAAVMVVLPTLSAGFPYDDTAIIRDNAGLRGWSSLLRAWGAPYWPSAGAADMAGLYRPLHVALLATVWNLSGGAPTAYHLYALVLYSAVVLLVWRLLRFAVGAAAAVAGAFFFATQPLHVEAFASVANSAELLVVVWTICLVMVLERAGRQPELPGARWKAALLVAALSAAAILSKESGLLSLPLAALTAWGWRGRAVVRSGEPRFGDLSFRTHGHLWLAGAAAVTVALLARAVVLGAPVARVSIAAPGLDALSPIERVAAMGSLWFRIGGMLVWPRGLSPYYGPTILPSQRELLAALAALVVLAVLGWAVARARRGERRPVVALGWVVLTYLPASNLLTATGQLLSDRALFGASVGAALAVGWALDEVRPRAARFAFAACALVVLRNGVESMRYADAWSSHRSLWQRLVDASPNEYRGYQLLGIDARERGDSSRALPLLARAFAMEPRDRRGRFEYGQVLYATGRYPLAAQILEPLLRDGDVRGEPGFVAMYLDAVGRSRGPEGVVAAGAPLLYGEAAVTAALFVGTAHEQSGRPAAADSAYVIGLRAQPGDSLLLARRALLEQAAAQR